jgi:hypothetical protein
MKTKSSKTSKTSTVRTYDGYRLRLTPTRLIQIDHTSINPWYATKEAIQRAAKNGFDVILIREVGTNQTMVTNFGQPRYVYTGGDVLGRIGCCLFTVPTFKKILRYFGVRKTKALAAKAGV